MHSCSLWNNSNAILSRSDFFSHRTSLNDRRAMTEEALLIFIELIYPFLFLLHSYMLSEAAIRLSILRSTLQSEEEDKYCRGKWLNDCSYMCDSEKKSMLLENEWIELYIKNDDIVIAHINARVWRQKALNGPFTHSLLSLPQHKWSCVYDSTCVKSNQSWDACEI